MRELHREDVIGARILEIIVSMPEEAVDMSSETVSSSRGFLRLSSGLLLDLSDHELPLFSAEEAAVHVLPRDRKCEQELASVIGEEIAEVALSEYLPDICVITRSGLGIAIDAPSPFWVGPCLFPKDSTYITEVKPIWKL